MKDVSVTVSLLNGWETARKLARVTVNKEDTDKPVSERFKIASCYSEHSHIREVRFLIELKNIPVWMSQQMSRHRIATNSGDFLSENVNPTDVEHYIQSKRPDRTGESRKGSDELCNYSFSANVQGLIDMSKKRLCRNAQEETREVWERVVEAVKTIDPVVGSVLVPTCIYRDMCPEFKGCGYDRSIQFSYDLARYQNFFQK